MQINANEYNPPFNHNPSSQAFVSRASKLAEVHGRPGLWRQAIWTLPGSFFHPIEPIWTLPSLVFILPNPKFPGPVVTSLTLLINTNPLPTGSKQAGAPLGQLELLRALWVRNLSQVEDS